MTQSPRATVRLNCAPSILIFVNRCFVNRWQVRTDPLHDWNYTYPTPIARKHIPLRGTLSRRMPDAGLHCVTGSHTVKIRDAKSFMFDGLCGHSALAYRYQRYLL